MTDESKRKLIRLMNRTEIVQGKASLFPGQNSRAISNDKTRREVIRAEIDSLSGEALDRELRRQILYTIPVLLMDAAIVGAVVLAVVMSIAHAP